MGLPSQPDWLDELEKDILKERAKGHPTLEVIEEVMAHRELLKDYLFPQLLKRSEFSFSQDAMDVVRHLLKEGLSLTDLLVWAVREGVPAEKIVRALNWEYFEDLVSAYLENFEWHARRTFRFRSFQSRRSNLEIDVIAWNRVNHMVLLIDCKRYKTPSAAPIRRAAELQAERTYQLLEKIPDIYDSPGLEWTKEDGEYRIYPLIVTWRDHQISEHQVDEGVVKICTITKFPDFLRNIRIGLSNSFSVQWSLI